ncbi:BMP family lipoprotein [Sphaerisporangium viridialbum]|uniref:BMP family lipoprotein n=1 Tax=Sphaerisporangium viridialbum TaxID=46189 RepID=UPI003C76F57C
MTHIHHTGPRRRAATLLAFGSVAALVLSACGGGSSSSSATSSSAASGGTGDGAGSAAGKTATLVSIQSVTDKGVMQDFVAGFKAATEKAGMKSNVVVLTDASTYESTLESVSARSDLIFTTFPPMIQAVEKVAPQHKAVSYVLLDARLGAPQSNVQELFFRENESSYLGGVVAGELTKAKKVGFLGALKQDVIDRYLVGFQAGVKSVDPGIKVCYAYVGSLGDPALGKQFANTMYDQGVDIIHAATAGTQVGVYQAAEEKKKFLVSADVDVRQLAPNYGLTATGPDFSGAAKVAVEQFAAGKFKTGLQVYGLADGAVRILPYNDKLVPQNVQADVEKAKQDIIAGTIKVPDDKSVDSIKNCA